MDEIQKKIIFTFFLIGQSFLVAFLQSDKRRFWKRLAIGVVSTVIIYGLMVLLAPYANVLESRIEGWMATIRGRLLIALVVIAAGAFAHWFKRSDKLRYGQVEVLFGALSVIGIATGIEPKDVLLSSWVGLAGSAYVVARGLNNWAEALEAQPDRYGATSIGTHIRSWFWKG